MDEQAIAEFISVTNSNRAAAIRSLSKTGGDIERSIELFYSEGGQSSNPAATAPQGSSRRRTTGGVKSLGDLRAEEEGNDHNDMNDYYVGGEKSGQVVQGNPDEGRQDAVEGLFERARQSGAQMGTTEDLNKGARGGAGFQSFTGRGHTVSGITTGSERREPQLGPQEEHATVTFYADGVFTVNDGEPRRMDDPRNGEFIRAIMNGECPSELMPVDPTTVININLVRKAEEYKPPEKPKYTAFTGTGHKLVAEEEDQPCGEEKKDDASTISSTWEGPDDSKPTTSIQIRLADGGRLVGRFNTTHTVGDIRRFLAAARPELQSGSFTLLMSFPRQELTDAGKTIEELGLAGSVLFQK